MLAVATVLAVVSAALPAQAAVVPVGATVETVASQWAGDSVDDPAIWVHPSDPSRSRVIVNNKGGALESYDLTGKLVQRVVEGTSFWGNVDVRQGVTIAGAVRDVAVVSHNNGVVVYTIDRSTGQLSNITDGTAIAKMGEGLCLYRSSSALHVFAITRPGVVRQFTLGDTDGDRLVDATASRSFAVGSETEGCVADDATGALYLAQEDVGLFRYGAEPTAGTTRVLVDPVVGGHAAADIEGVTLVNTGGSGGYIFASDQNVVDWRNSYFTAYQRTGSNAYVTSFRVTATATADDCDRTDGIAAYYGNLGPAFPKGIFVCQDGNNSAPGTGNQSLKYVPLQNIVPVP